MWSRWFPVHLCLTDVSVFHASIKHFHQLITVKGCLLRKVFHKNTSLSILSDVEFLLFFRVKQVHDLFVIKFKIRTCHQTFWIFHSVYSGKKLSKRLLHQTIVLSNHSMSFTRSCLSIHKDTRIISVEDISQESVSDMVKNINLGSRSWKDFIKTKLMFL